MKGLGGQRKLAANWVMGELSGALNKDGIEVAQSWGAIWTVRDGRVTRMELGYADREAALAAARLAA